MAALTRSEYGEVMHLPAGQIVKKSSGGMEIYISPPPHYPLTDVFCSAVPLGNHFRSVYSSGVRPYHTVATFSPSLSLSFSLAFPLSR